MERITPAAMASKKKPDLHLCSGGVKHPTRDLKCWGNHDKSEAHWATITDVTAKTGVRKITWRD